jgi:hypothetical protein
MFTARITAVHFILQHLYALCMSNSLLIADHWLLGSLCNMVANPLIDIIYQQILFFWHNSPHRARASSGQVISSSRRPLPASTQHSQQTLMPPAGFEPTISAGDRLQIYSLDRAATRTGTASNERCLLRTIGCGNSHHGLLKNTIR